MKKSIPFILMVYFCFLVQSSFKLNAQSWNVSFEEEVLWIKDVPGSNAVLVGVDGWIIHAVDKKTGNQLFQIGVGEFNNSFTQLGKKVEFRSFVPKTTDNPNLIIISNENSLSENADLILIDLVSGNTIFSAIKDAKFGGGTRSHYLKNGDILISDKTKAALISPSGNILWEIDKPISSIIVKQNYFLITHKTSLNLVDLRDGTVAWNEELSESKGSFMPAGDLVFRMQTLTAKMSYLASINYDEGEVNWKYDFFDDPAKFGVGSKGFILNFKEEAKVIDILSGETVFTTEIEKSSLLSYDCPSDQNCLLSYDNGKVVSIDINSGNTLWENDFGLFGTPPLLGKNGFGFYNFTNFFYSDYEGNEIWKNKFIQTAGPIEKVMYGITKSGFSKIDFDTGKITKLNKEGVFPTPEGSQVLFDNWVLFQKFDGKNQRYKFFTLDDSINYERTIGIIEPLQTSKFGSLQEVLARLHSPEKVKILFSKEPFEGNKKMA